MDADGITGEDGDERNPRAALRGGAVRASPALPGHRTGRLPVVTEGALASAAMAVPMFLLAATRMVGLLWLGMILFNVGRSLVYGPLPALVSAMLPARVRFTGISLSYQLAGILGGGIAPVVVVALVGAGGGYQPVAAYRAGTGRLSAGCLVAIARRIRSGADTGHLANPAPASATEGPPA